MQAFYSVILGVNKIRFTLNEELKLIRTWNNYFAYPCFDYQTNEENGFEDRTFFFSF